MDMKLGNSRCQCATSTGGCGEYFNSLTAFDKHRVGEYGGGRRCMTRDEMEASGMSVNSDGFWISIKGDIGVLVDYVAKRPSEGEKGLPSR